MKGTASRFFSVPRPTANNGNKAQAKFVILKILVNTF
jgi:hypothetical protein